MNQRFSMKSSVFRGLSRLPGLLALSCASAWGSQALPEGLHLERELALHGHHLSIQGSGVRARPGGGIDYVMGLYLQHGCQSVPNILTSQEAKSVKVVFVEGMTFNRGRKIMVEDLIINVDAELFNKVSQQLGKLISQGPSSTGFPKGSWIAFNFLPGQGTEFVVNGVESEVIPGDDLYRALLMQWVGPHPFSREFKSSVLGDCS